MNCAVDDEGPEEGEAPDVKQRVQIESLAWFNVDRPVQGREGRCDVARRRGFGEAVTAGVEARSVTAIENSEV